jgi:DNA repair exonuclease SbcCD ATPase subunit
MFERKPLLVKDLPLYTIKAVVNCYNNLDEESAVVDVLHEIAIEYKKRTNEKDQMSKDAEKFESDIKDKYEKLERKLKNSLAEEESAMIKSFNTRAEKSEEEIYQLKTQVANLTQDLGLIKKENAILEQKIDNQDELISEISELEALVAALTAENNEKDKKFDLLKSIYDNPKIQEVKVIEPQLISPVVVEPRMIPTVSCNQK